MKISIELAKICTQYHLHGKNLGQALIDAEGIAINPKLAKLFHIEVDWTALMIKHGLPENTTLKQPLDRWIALHFDNANTALFNDKKDLAWKWMASGKDTSATNRKKYHLEPRKMIQNDKIERKIIRFRELDKSTDWNTCK